MLLIDAFVAVTAIGGGLAMTTRIGKLPLAWLAGTPFRSYLIPGMLLTLAVGGSAALATVATAFDARAGAVTSAGAGAVMMGWIAVEFRMLDQSSWLEALYFGAGLAMVVLAAIVWRA
jgi:hypothetical protein